MENIQQIFNTTPAPVINLKYDLVVWQNHPHSNEGKWAAQGKCYIRVNDQ